jgi:hypothetical protein
MEGESQGYQTWQQVQDQKNKHLGVTQNFGALEKLHQTSVGWLGPQRIFTIVRRYTVALSQGH